MRRFWRAVAWGVGAYRYQRNKPHGKRATGYEAAMIGFQGAHLIGWQKWRWINPTAWLLWVGHRRLKRKPGEVA